MLLSEVLLSANSDIAGSLAELLQTPPERWVRATTDQQAIDFPPYSVHSTHRQQLLCTRLPRYEEKNTGPHMVSHILVHTPPVHRSRQARIPLLPAQTTAGRSVTHLTHEDCP